MKKVKLNSRMAGPEGNYPPGSVLSVQDKIADQLIEGGYAVFIEPVEVPAEAPEVMKKPEPEPEPIPAEKPKRPKPLKKKAVK